MKERKICLMQDLADLASLTGPVKATCKIGREPGKIAQKWWKNDQVWTDEPITCRKIRI